MLLKQSTLAAVASGDITLAFRRWKRPTVKAGGTLVTPIGVLAIDALDVVDPAAISDAEARAAGFPDADALRVELDSRSSGDGQGTTYRVTLRLAGADPRIALREATPDADELAALHARLDRWDRASKTGPWTRQALEVIAQRPETRAAELAEQVGVDRAVFKTRVRKLKGLGLTESLMVGYCLSRRGRAVLGR